MDDGGTLTEHLVRGGRARDLGWTENRIIAAFDEAIRLDWHPDIRLLKDIHETGGDVVAEDDAEQMLDWYVSYSHDKDDINRFMLTWQTPEKFQHYMHWSTDRARLALEQLLRDGKLIYDHPRYAMPESPTSAAPPAAPPAAKTGRAANRQPS